MKTRILAQVTTVTALCVAFFSPRVDATSNYNYKPNEYVVIVHGRSPDGRYSIASHGEGESGYDNFHIYLMDAQTGKKIGPLEEIKETFDTGADAYYAKWSASSSQVSISYRADRHAAVIIRYSIKGRRAYLQSGPTPVDKLKQ